MICLDLGRIHRGLETQIALYSCSVEAWWYGTTAWGSNLVKQNQHIVNNRVKSCNIVNNRQTSCTNHQQSLKIKNFKENITSPTRT